MDDRRVVAVLSRADVVVVVLVLVVVIAAIAWAVVSSDALVDPFAAKNAVGVLPSPTVEPDFLDMEQRLREIEQVGRARRYVFRSWGQADRPVVRCYRRMSGTYAVTLDDRLVAEIDAPVELFDPPALCAAVTAAFVCLTGGREA